MAEKYFRISSGCRAGAWPAGMETRQPQRLPYKQYATANCSNRCTAEREREGSTARSIQRTKMRRVVRYREAAAQRLAANAQRTHPPERENLHRRIARHRVPNLLFSQKRQRARLCSTAPGRIVRFASQAWNGKGTRFALCRFPMRPPRMRNGSRLQSMSRSQARQLPSACSRSLPPNSFCGASTQIFSCESTIGAIGAEGMLSGGTTSGIGPVDTGRISGCSTRVAMSIAVKSSAPARK